MKEERASKERIADLSMDTVLNVYSGKAHKCCCGCSGIHRHNSRFPKEYDYQVDNDRQVKKVIDIIKEHANLAVEGGNHVVVELGDKWYIAYTGE